MSLVNSSVLPEHMRAVLPVTENGGKTVSIDFTVPQCFFTVRTSLLSGPDRICCCFFLSFVNDGCSFLQNSTNAMSVKYGYY